MAPRGNLDGGDHLRFLAITDKTRRSYEKAVAAVFQKHCWALMRNWRSMSITFIMRSSCFTSGLDYLRAEAILAPVQISFDDSPALCAQLAPGPPAPRLYTSFLARGQGKGRLVLSWFSFFLRTMELLSLQFRQVRIFKNEGTVVIAIANSKTSGGVFNNRFPYTSRPWWLSFSTCGGKFRLRA